MNATPEDLVETWHLITADGDEPIKWLMDQAMWDAVVDARNKRAAIDAGDHLADEQGMTLLGTPVQIGRTTVPQLKYRSGEDGEVYGTPVLGETGELSPAMTLSHGRGTGARNR